MRGPTRWSYRSNSAAIRSLCQSYASTAIIDPSRAAMLASVNIGSAPSTIVTPAAVSMPSHSSNRPSTSASASPASIASRGTTSRMSASERGDTCRGSRSINAMSVRRRRSIDDAIRPGASKLTASGITPSAEYRPCDGLKPATPQNAAGMRIDPLVSEPSARSATPSATATAPPDVEPPLTRSSPGHIGVVGLP